LSIDERMDILKLGVDLVCEEDTQLVLDANMGMGSFID